MHSGQEATETRVPRFRAAGPTPVVGAVLADRFELVRELGRGGAGVVFAAMGRTGGQLVALKVIDPALVDDRTRERLRREVNASRPAHPNAGTGYELYHEDGLHFLTMELVDGPSLREVLRAEALLADGRRDEALAAAGGLLRTATPDVLPAILASEVAAAAGSGS